MLLHLLDASLSHMLVDDDTDGFTLVIWVDIVQVLSMDWFEHDAESDKIKLPEEFILLLFLVVVHKI